MRLIDADALKMLGWEDANDAAFDINNAPTIDAVVVIRCEGCGWYRPDSETCSFWPDEGYRHPKHFCGEGKPK